jgi:hypothetical protein
LALGPPSAAPCPEGLPPVGLFKGMPLNQSLTTALVAPSMTLEAHVQGTCTPSFLRYTCCTWAVRSGPMSAFSPGHPCSPGFSVALPGCKQVFIPQITHDSCAGDAAGTKPHPGLRVHPGPSAGAAVEAACRGSLALGLFGSLSNRELGAPSELSLT